MSVLFFTEIEYSLRHQFFSYFSGTASVVKTLSVYIDGFLNHTVETHLKELYEIDVPYISQYFDVLAFAICVGFSGRMCLHYIFLLNNGSLEKSTVFYQWQKEEYPSRYTIASGALKFRNTYINTARVSTILHGQ